jgi:carbohydrate diacid regulator
MYISKNTAISLIKEISAIIDYDINIMNEEGSIIASTDPFRTGQFHEGAYLIINNNLDELIVHYDEEYAGCKKGINLPIMLNESIIGVIGITGEASEIMKYGNLIRKVTEILIRDLFKLQQATHKELEKQTFVNGWLNGDIENRADIEKGIEKYNLNKHSPFVIAIIKARKENAQIESVIVETLNRSGMLATCGSGMGIVISNLQSAEKCYDCISAALSPYEGSYVCSIGTCQPDYTGVAKSYREAQQILQVKANEKKGIFLFDKELLNIIIDDVSMEYKVKFTQKVFKDCTRDEILEFIDFITIFYNNNGSIKAIAEALFLHKNTVQYKINKILQRTGLDLRKLSSLTELHLAAIWYLSLK